MYLDIRKARIEDIDRLVEVINAAYRNQFGRSWTTEKVFVDGVRITKEQLSRDLNQSNFELLVGENEQGSLVGCIGLNFDSSSVEIGTFAIDPTIQNLGIGHRMLSFAEKYIRDTYADVLSINLYVLNVRKELIEYYERRGFNRTGVVDDYPITAEVGIPLIPVSLVEMTKRIS
ncbi:GNAT family N-acetyltransferase [Acinetobacter junii]|uniref:GNAT family N-acetyltransferase n=1 Tax=Acinetobacter junii TaxID=40215 RepID=A0AAX1MK69_ACIJU|nr:GNAT family N-acetyltransferase [Acinetobacter junii]QUY37993.1 GNAT family N-acetyltransferase [Acinetobacter junii]